ncbi:shugoshin 2 [Phaenicophaeus curvirostris]|uniref:shugoshin 2 n=1 Tax=Phaenicophaeus curvirostris TaxID=33595 RepID=UPI0037F0EB6C
MIGPGGKQCLQERRRKFVLMMDKEAAAKLSTISTMDAVKGRMRKRDGTYQAAKRNAALASKIKTKLINNSSMFKVSLQQNNKALAVALSAEKENSRKLKNEIIFLQKEVDKLQLHNILFRQKLNYLNKTLKDIGAFLNNKFLTAIEISSLSENLQHAFLLSADPSNPAHDQFNNTHQPARPVELPVELPSVTTANAKQQDSASVSGIPNSYKCTTVLSMEMHSDQDKFASLFPCGTNNEKLIETDPVETTSDKTIFSKENKLSTEPSCNSAFLTDTKTTQSLGQSEKLTKQYNDSSVPFGGNITERKKRAVRCKPKPHPKKEDFDQTRSSNKLPHHINSGSNTNDMNLQERSSDLSHIIPSPLEFSKESKTEYKKMLFANKMKAEETVYDADMELTASDAGELLTVIAKDKGKLNRNKNSNAHSDEIIGDFRKVKYSKKDKEKIKSKTEVYSNFYTDEGHGRADSSKVSKTTDSQNQLFQSQTEQLPTGNSVSQHSLLNTSTSQAQISPSEAKDTRRIYQVNLMSPRKQETNKETFSATFEDMESKIQEADSNSSVAKIPPEVHCAENLSFQDNTSTVLPLQHDFLHTSGKCNKPKINRKSSQIPSKMNPLKYFGEENGQYAECISKMSQRQIEQHDSKGKKQDQNIIMKRKYNKKSSYRQSREAESDSIHNITQKVDRNSILFSPGRLKRTLAKASRKACIISRENLTRFSSHKNEELKNKDALHAEAVCRSRITETQQMQVALVIQNAIAINTPQAKEQVDADMSKEESSSVAHKNPHISNSPYNQVKLKQSFSSDGTETRSEKKCFGYIDQGGQNILDDQEVPHKRNSSTNKSKPVVQKSDFLKFLPVECSKNMPLNVDRFSQESLSNVELPALENQNGSVNFSILKNSEIFKENYHNKALDAGKAEQKLDLIPNETYKKTLTPCHGTKVLQDLTNTSIPSRSSLPKSPKTAEGNSVVPSRRGRATICYKEPSLQSKLRRGDQFTDMQFLDSPIYKGKKKRSFKSKSKFI